MRLHPLRLPHLYGDRMSHVVENEKGKWYLHRKDRLWYYSHNAEGAEKEIPAGYQVGRNPKTGMPYLKKA